MTYNEILNLEVDADHSAEGPISIRSYLRDLLATLWEEKEGFSGKRPFGNSLWQYEIYSTLVKNKIVPGRLDELGYVEECDTNQADQIIMDVIDNCL